MDKTQEIHSDNIAPKALSIARSIANDIERGVYKKNDQLPSINELSKSMNCARGTIEKAYAELRRIGYIVSIKSKGFFVTGEKKAQLKILLIFNRLGHFKRMIYDGFISTIGKNAKVDLHVHHYDVDLFREILEDKKNSYHYYVIMPHFFFPLKNNKYLKVLEKIGMEKVVLLDKDLPELGNNRRGVVQDFKYDIYNALTGHLSIVNKYNCITLIIQQQITNLPEIIEGVKEFCINNNKEILVLNKIKESQIKENTLYITTHDEDLAVLIKDIRKSSFELGKQIGILSFNETIFKELLDISVFTTDFKKMGIYAAELILKNKQNLFKNPFSVINRNSF